MVRINLTPGEKSREPKARRAPRVSVRRPEWLSGSPSLLVGLVGLLVLLAAVFLYFGERRGISQARAAIEDARADSARFHTEIARVRAMEDVQSQLVARVDILEEVVDGRLFWIRLLETLSLQLPEYTWLEAVNQEDLPPEEIRIAGATFSNPAITAYMRGLEASPELQSVRLVGVTRALRQETPVQTFTLLATFENFDPVVITPPDTTAVVIPDTTAVTEEQP
ncbi:MAG TPA: PilN domain-containing protein [Gemmatimonadota bacterium]|nr:PilN domain-containing protein [Gemmatimonadota bacterium]